MTSLSIFVRVAFFFFSAFLIISIFCWIKLFFEINKIRRLNKLNNELSLLTAPFFLTKLLEIKKLATKNAKYVPIFLYFCKSYQDLFSRNGLTFLNNFFQKSVSQQNWSDFLAESEFHSNFFKTFSTFQKNVNQFASDLRAFSAFEEKVIEKTNVLNLVLDKIDEDLKAIKIKLKFNFNEVDRIFNLLSDDLEGLKKIIYYQDHNNTLQVLFQLENKVNVFVDKFFDWLKLVNIALIVLVSKNKELVECFSKIENNKLQSSTVGQILNAYDQNRVQIELLLENFEVEDGKNLVLKLLVQTENKIFQLQQRATMKRIFEQSFKFVTDYFETISKSFLTFDQIAQSFNKDLFYRQFENAGFQNSSVLINQTRKQIDNLLVQNYDTEEIYFFQSLLAEIERILENCFNLIEIRNQMELFLQTEKEKNEKIFLTLLNLRSLLDKKNNFVLKVFFDKNLNKLMERFLFLEQKRLHSQDQKKGKDYNQLFDSFQTEVVDLKNNLKNTFFLKFIAELLFVKVNKLRFGNELYHNKILNCEILFLKQQYKNVIEMLLDILKPNSYF